MNRRGFFGTLAAVALLPFAKLRKPSRYIGHRIRIPKALVVRNFDRRPFVEYVDLDDWVFDMQATEI